MSIQTVCAECQKPTKLGFMNGARFTICRECYEAIRRECYERVPVQPITDPTVARIAGNIAGQWVALGGRECVYSDEQIAEWTVRLARAIVAEVERGKKEPSAP